MKKRIAAATKQLNIDDDNWLWCLNGFHLFSILSFCRYIKSSFNFELIRSYIKCLAWSLFSYYALIPYSIEHGNTFWACCCTRHIMIFANINYNCIVTFRHVINSSCFHLDGHLLITSVYVWANSFSLPHFDLQKIVLNIWIIKFAKQTLFFSIMDIKTNEK